MKYITFPGGKVICFSDGIEHRELAQTVHAMMGNPRSAGFVRLASGLAETYGESDSLGLKSSPGDAAIINANLRGGLLP